MSLLTQAYLLDRYGPLLTDANLAAVLHVDAGSLRNMRASGDIDIPVIRRGKTPLYAAEDVAAYLDRIRLAVAA